MIVVENI